MESKESELQQAREGKDTLENEIKLLRENIDKLNEQNSQQQNGGCNSCSVL